MQSQYTGSPAAARLSMIESLIAVGCPRDQAERRVAEIAPPITTGFASERRLRWAAKRHQIEQDGEFDASQFAMLVALYGCCLRCERDDLPLVPDHIVPLSGGGRHVIWNIQPLCAACNIWKGRRAIDYRVGRQRVL